MRGMAIYPKAVYRPVPLGTDYPIDPDTVVIHVDAGDAYSLYGWFNGPSGGIESHFHVRKDGTVEQYRDTAWQADAQRERGRDAISIETQGKAAGEWTGPQLAALKDLILWCHKTHKKITLTVPTSPAGPGVGYHSMFPEWPGDNRSCPGPDRIKQYKSIIVPWMKSVTNPAPRVYVTKVATTLAALAAALGVSVVALQGANPGLPVGPSATVSPNVTVTIPPPLPVKPVNPPKVLYPTMRKGSTGSQVKALQQKLGVSSDGHYGPITERAVRGYQRTHSLLVDGIAGPKTLAALAKSPWGAVKQTTVRYGSTGAAVSRVQALVGCAVDGHFGQITRRYVISFQKAHALSADGVVGPRTWAALTGRV